jgi:hypothetical protein
MTKKTRSLRLDKEQLDELTASGVNVSELCRELIGEWLKHKKCPVCNQAINAKIPLLSLKHLGKQE